MPLAMDLSRRVSLEAAGSFTVHCLEAWTARRFWKEPGLWLDRFLIR
jgi:hypothetical protein